MTPEEEALATVDGMKSLRLEGKEMRANVIQVLTGASVDRTIEGASTLTLDFYDDERTLLQSGLLDTRVTTQLDKYSFELVQVRKSGHHVTAVFEDLAVAALRRHRDPMKVAPGKFTHVDFAKRLVAEEKWIKFHVPKGVKAPKSRVALTRGTPRTKGQKAEKESTWDALGRNAEDRGWRRFIRGKNTLWYTPETILFEAEPKLVFEEFSNGVDYIDFDFDAGKPAASLTIGVRAKRWAAPVGTTVRVRKLGPADGKWLVKKISRSLFDLNATVTLEKPLPTLPEPKPAPKPKPMSGEGSSSGKSGEGRTVSTGSSSSSGYVWPCRGSITSGFGYRGSYFHGGIDIAVPTGTPVGSVKAGTVIAAGWMGGDSYGNAVYVDHGGTISRYAHLSKITCTRGQHVDRGEQIGLSGSTGNSTGPHLHLEIRPGDTPRNPLEFLP